MCYLYWLHLPTDILSEGYIGVTNEPKRRLREHKLRLEGISSQSIMTILLQGSEEYCYEVEAKLRPEPNIGLNRMVGGYKPPSHKGKKHPIVQARMLTKENPMNNPKSRIKISNNVARDWLVCYLQNEPISIHNLNKFCRENKLSPSAMNGVDKGRRKHHKGWTCKKLKVV